MRYLPVAPLSTSLARVERVFEAHEADPRVVASLVRARLRLDRARGWVLLSSLVATAAIVVGVGAEMHGKWIVGVLAPLVASVPFAFSLFAERAMFAWFSREARGHGLSEQATRRIYDGALGADHWMGVLASCGRPPSDGEIAQFVLHVAR